MRPTFEAQLRGHTATMIRIATVVAKLAVIAFVFSQLIQNRIHTQQVFKRLLLSAPLQGLVDDGLLLANSTSHTALTSAAVPAGLGSMNTSQ